MKKSFDVNKQNELARKFHLLHNSKKPLILVNAWDCISARMVEECGASAVATSSASMAWSLGYKDGGHFPPDLLLEQLGRITRSVNLPVSADIEDGYYRDDINKFGDFIANLIESGVVGINLEDSNAKTNRLYDIEIQQKFIEKAREISNKIGVDLFINARIDAFDIKGDIEQNQINICFERAKVYQSAGASGIFIPFINKFEVIKILKEHIELPLNILVNNNLSVDDLKSIGINRISVGGKPILALMSNFKQIISLLNNSSDWNCLYVKEPQYPQVNSWFI